MEFSEKTQNRIEGFEEGFVTLIQENHIVHTAKTAKDLADSAYKILYGEDPDYKAPAARAFKNIGNF